MHLRFLQAWNFFALRPCGSFWGTGSSELGALTGKLLTKGRGRQAHALVRRRLGDASTLPSESPCPPPPGLGPSGRCGLRGLRSGRRPPRPGRGEGEREAGRGTVRRAQGSRPSHFGGESTGTCPAPRGPAARPGRALGAAGRAPVGPLPPREARARPEIRFRGERDGTLPFATTRTDLEGIILSEIIQTDTGKLCDVAYLRTL